MIFAERAFTPSWLRTASAALFVATPIAIAAGCGDDGGEDGTCVPGSTAECFCSGQRRGVQTCADDGASYDACDCSTGDAGSGGGNNAGSGGTMGASGGSAGQNMGGAGGQGGPQFNGATGSACETDEDCFAGMTCISSSVANSPFGEGGPQGGYCTSLCNTPEDCTSVDGLSDCFPIDDTGTTSFCLSICPLGVGSPLGPPCSGRSDLACANVFPDGSTAGLCLPTCWSDADCGGGRICDLGSGLCVDDLEGRGPGQLGDACNQATQIEDCSTATCFPTEPDGSGFCTGFCTLAAAGPVGCGFGPEGTRDAACTPLAIDPPPIAGDQGFCTELCDVDADCAQPALYECVALSQAGQDFLGRGGQCLPRDEPDAGGAAPADAG